MGGGSGAGAGGTRSKWGQMPAGGWTPDQQERWDAEEQVRKTRAAEMHKRVEREEEELKRNPEKVSKKIVGAIQSMGVKPDRDHVDSLAAKVIAYRRQRTRKEGNELFTDKAMAREGSARKGRVIRSQQVSEAHWTGTSWPSPCIRGPCSHESCIRHECTRILDAVQTHAP